MATAGWRSNRPLSALVFEQHGSFNVFQLMRLLQWKKRRPAAARAVGEREWRPLPAGKQARPGRRLRFRADLSAAFPGNEITLLRARPDQADAPDGQYAAGGGAIDIDTPNFCIASAIGPLPEPFTEWLRELRRSREPAMEDFLNIFNQRLNVLRFELKARQTMALNHEAPEDTRQARYLAALMGMGQPQLAAQVPLPRRAWLGLAGLLGNARHSAFTVRHVLAQFVGAETELEQLVGAWLPIEADNRIALGQRNHALGQQSVLGRRVWDQQARVRLTVAALPYENFCRLLPPNDEERLAARPAVTPDGAAAPAFDGFVALVRLLLDRQCDCELRLQAAEAPPRALSAAPAPRQGRHWGLRLGQTAWLGGAAGGDAPPARAGYLVRAYDNAGAA